MEFVTVFTFLFINILALGVTMGLSPNMYRDVGDFSPISTDVIIIGGGATGAGIARDCALRGINCILLERRDIATGATGRNHGLLHSGARYAVNDQESAEECIKENKILRNIARHCVDETEGLFITLPEDSLDYQKTFIESCTKSGIEAVAIDPKLAQIMEPSVNPDLVGCRCGARWFNRSFPFNGFQRDGCHRKWRENVHLLRSEKLNSRRWQSNRCGCLRSQKSRKS